ncbi:hypothetical protein [Streptomyces sp. NPDC002265]
MTGNRLSPGQLGAREAMFSGIAHLSCGQGAYGGRERPLDDVCQAVG